ncbi:DNA methyltransferase [Halomonas salipaludis]|uniref:site-specific DNA-methyltransferase (adenine-specific) n=1 Tax=Halomonas salipaludis TaxID=2032625 RepID=A0A2A2EQB5_9GAMM|nr:DNA methyltransferase [Halomonas salipaludis]PAU74589.1 DNA methyltransferase [Halomonas salipaludis]
MENRKQSLEEFVTWCKRHITGDEKGEAQIFLDHLFKAFGHEGLREAGATCEVRVKKEKKGTSFADLVWKPKALIEMKKRGEDLSKHYRQAFYYWTRLVPDRPNWVILCNFDEFWVYDFNTQMDTPVDKVSLRELPDRYGPLAFMFFKEDLPVFGNHQEKVTQNAADKLVDIFRSLVERGVDRELAQRFSLQALVALFAEDIGLLTKYFFSRLLEDCTSSEKSYDLIGQLFTEMDTPGTTSGGRFKGVPYFNGGLFNKPARIELQDNEVGLLKEAARFDWSKVRPEIFGSIFEHSMNSSERRASGSHYTTPVDIIKVVSPTIVEPWQERIESAKTLKGLETLLMEIEGFKVLDPACGSGNFLYIAYREIKRLEARIYERMAEYRSIDPSQRPMGFVSTSSFFGIDRNEFAVELAKVTMMLAHKLAIDELHINEQALPLDNLNDNFTVCDALINKDGERTKWPEANVIIGNPPFIGAKRIKPENGDHYSKLLRAAYPEIPGMADYCVYWFKKANDFLIECTSKDWKSGRAGLVGTQNIRSNASRKGGLDAICKTGTIIDAVDNQPWSGEANVNVSIVNWVKSKDTSIIGKKKKLWSIIKQERKKTPKKGKGPAKKYYELAVKEVSHINASLSDKTDVGNAHVLKHKDSIKQSFQGITPGHEGFVLPKSEVEKFPKPERGIFFPYLVGDEFLSGKSADRYILDLGQSNILEAQKYKHAFSYIQDTILPDRKEAAKDRNGNIRPHHKAFLKRWWQLSWRREEMQNSIEKLPRYIACSRVTTRPIFFFVNSKIKPGDALQVFSFSDLYSFGILQSSVHYSWFHAKCSNMKSDPRYTSQSIFETFPWPQDASTRQIGDVAEAAKNLCSIRDRYLSENDSGLRGIYKTLDLPGVNPLKEAHENLDSAVEKAYEFSTKKDILSQLLELNEEVYQRIERGEETTHPGIPTSYTGNKELLK